MKPAPNHPAYPNPSLMKTTKVYMLLLSGGISLSVLIILLQLFSYFSQAGGSRNTSSSETPQKNQNNHVIAAASMVVATEVNIEEKKPAETPVVYNAIAAPEKNLIAPAILKASVKSYALLKADKMFLKENDARNEEIVQELSQVVDMHEFHFKKSSSQLSHKKSMAKFDSSLQKCIEAPETWTKIIILGFTDNRGSKLVNVKLGMKRAMILKQMLVKKGIPAEKITVASFGPELPIGSNNTEAGRAINRRVEFNLVGVGS